MDVRHLDDRLERVEREAGFTAGYAQVIVKAFRKRMQLIRAAVDERDFRNLKSLHFEKLSGDREEQYSMRLNDQWRLIIQMTGEAQHKTVVVIEIADYH
jgi:toxin HigB-1